MILQFLALAACVAAGGLDTFLTSDFFKRVREEESKLRTANAREVVRMLEWAAVAMAAINLDSNPPISDGCKLSTYDFTQLKNELCLKGFHLCHFSGGLAMFRSNANKLGQCEDKKFQRELDYYVCGTVWSEPAEAETD